MSIHNIKVGSRITGLEFHGQKIGKIQIENLPESETDIIYQFKKPNAMKNTEWEELAIGKSVEVEGEYTGFRLRAYIKPTWEKKMPTIYQKFAEVIVTLEEEKKSNM